MTEAPAKMHEGKVVGVAGGEPTTACAEGEQHRHTMAEGAKVTFDGQASKAADLEAGTDVPVAAHEEDETVATAVESGKRISAPAAHKAPARKS